MDPLTIGAVLLAIISGASGELGTQLWAGVGTLVSRPFRRQAAGSASPTLPTGEAELAALEQTPADERHAVALAEVLIARAGADAGFRRALEDWWEQASPIHACAGNVTNTISGGTQHGPVLQGRDFSNVTFGTPRAAQPDQRSSEQDA